MINLDQLLEMAVNKNASDVHLTVGTYPYIRVNGELVQAYHEKLTVENTKEYSQLILGEDYKIYEENGEIDSTYSLSGIGRFRVNIYKQRNSDALAIRTVGGKVPSLKELDLPASIKELASKKRGLILVTGPTGSGKSTTLAAMINEINNARCGHIITLENPIEFLHKHNKSIVNQREIGKDSKSFESALKSLLREDPDVVFVGELDSLETITVALRAAENGHLVLSSLHTIGASNTIHRIVDVFPPYQQEQVKSQLAAVLQGVISQQLVPRVDEKGRIAALEIMLSTPSIQNLIREGRISQIESIIQTGNKLGMKTMDMSLVELYKKKVISKDTAITYAVDKEIITRMMLL
ncbi:type IV pilus twitching motility protein PilT [Hathewaya histolytica]|uniref:Twitching motility protein n=1 Tax=Hathewaya histolytica TaxID=1498 RepID=A0A4U9RGP8_HATHI|nr:type IV pilus twitching motility protein PilT [Hathewaya histolytica]VTQ90358.1 twitching motility protein [Hathewaya histolytica]